MATVPPTDLPASTPLPGAELISAAGLSDETRAATDAAIVDLVTHASKPGPSTSEFYAPIVAPAIAFVVGLIGSWAVTTGLVGSGAEQAIIPPLVGGATSLGAAWAAKGYAVARTELKKVMLQVAHNHTPAPPA